MSFSEMMSSARGPGVIGMLMALAVLAIFVLLFIFAFDDRFQGGARSIQSVIAQQATDIESFKSTIAEGETTLAGGIAKVAAAKEVTRLKSKNESLRSQIESLTEKEEAVKAGSAETQEAFENYKDQYRAFVRGKAKGEVIATLETGKGDIYKNVSIREVTAIGIQIRHDAGQKRIPYEDLPLAMQDHFQFDAKQKAAAVAKEQSTWNEHEAAVSQAGEMSERQSAEKTKQEEIAGREKMDQVAASKEARIRSLSREIQSLEFAIQREGQKAISNAPQMRVQLSKMQAELSALRESVNRMRLGNP